MDVWIYEKKLSLPCNGRHNTRWEYESYFPSTLSPALLSYLFCTPLRKNGQTFPYVFILFILGCFWFKLKCSESGEYFMKDNGILGDAPFSQFQTGMSGV